MVARKFRLTLTPLAPGAKGLRYQKCSVWGFFRPIPGILAEVWTLLFPVAFRKQGTASALGKHTSLADLVAALLLATYQIAFNFPTRPA